MEQNEHQKYCETKAQKKIIVSGAAAKLIGARKGPNMYTIYQDSKIGSKPGFYTFEEAPASQKKVVHERGLSQKHMEVQGIFNPDF